DRLRVGTRLHYCLSYTSTQRIAIAPQSDIAGLLFSFQRPTVLRPPAGRLRRPSEVGAASSPPPVCRQAVFFNRSRAALSSEGAGTTRLFAASGSRCPRLQAPASTSRQ